MRKIFVSSTSKDLAAFRSRVLRTLAEFGEGAEAMEHFEAQPNTPVETCKQLVKQADGLILIVGFRYGWIPTEQEGGDGTSSITWIETRTAVDAGIPVFAFVADEDVRCAWTHGRDTDDFYEDDADLTELTWRRVRGLRAFRAYVDTTFTRCSFSTPEDLAVAVSASLTKWARDGIGPLSPLARRVLAFVGDQPVSVDTDAICAGMVDRGTPAPADAIRDAVHELAKRKLVLAMADQVRLTSLGRAANA